MRHHSLRTVDSNADAVCRLSPLMVSPRLHRRTVAQSRPRCNGIDRLPREHQVVGAAASLASPVSKAPSFLHSRTVTGLLVY
jgi:hypothetical protein